MRKTMVMVAATAMAVAGCGGSGGASGGASSSAGLNSAVTACLKSAGFKHDPNLATVGLEGADPIFASDAGVTIYTAKSPAAAARIARGAKASEAEGSVGRRLYLSRADQAAKVRGCLKS